MVFMDFFWGHHKKREKEDLFLLYFVLRMVALINFNKFEL